MNKARSPIFTEVYIGVIGDGDTADIVRCSEIHGPPRMNVVYIGARYSILATVYSPTRHVLTVCADLTGRLV